MRVLMMLAAATIAANLVVHAALGPVQLNFADQAIESLDNVPVIAIAELPPNQLDLSHNHIVELPEDVAVLNFTELLVLDLSHNYIHNISGAPFRTLKALRVLNLSGNAIDSISVNSFRGPEALQSLDLSHNNLTVLVDNIFVPLINLQHLNLSGNRLRNLPDGCFSSLQRLQQLDVSWNQLQHVAPSTLQALPSLARLLIAGNPLLGSGAKDAALLVGMGRRLQTVDASRIGLQHVPATLTHSVRTLRLAGNYIHTVRCGDLDSYPLLQLLDLTTNALEHIEEDALGRLEMLTILYLTDNKLHAIPRSLPDRLEALHLEFNEIEQIVSGDLLGLPKLEILLLNDNKIKVVQEGAFNQVTSLVTLDLSRNPISILPADTLAGPNRLQVLRLAGLSVQPPAEDMTFPVPTPEHLVRLDLSGSSGLARQLLADTAALAAFRELQELNLANTDLINVRSDLLHYLPQMHDFHLSGNRLNCSGLLWLAMWMRRQDQPEYRQVTCDTPLELYGVLVMDLQDSFVTEIQSTTPSTTTIVVSTTEITTTKPIDIKETSTFSNMEYDFAFNNETTESEAYSIVTNLNSTVKSLMTTEIIKQWDSDQYDMEAAVVAENMNRSTVNPSTDQLQLLPITSEYKTEQPSVDNGEALVSVTDGHIEKVTSSENVTGGTMRLKPMYAAAAAAAAADVGGGSTRITRAPVAVFVLLVAVLGAGVAIVFHAKRWRQRRYARQRDIEVDSLASVHELW